MPLPNATELPTMPPKNSAGRWSRTKNWVAGRIAGSAERYQGEMNQVIDRQAGAQVAGVNAGAGQAIGGFQRGANQARAGVEQNYQLELGANKQIYVSQVDAAG
ncbi:MAG: hypothetical protein ACREBG_24350 [Pyrinomonadaceae bacterium]